MYEGAGGTTEHPWDISPAAAQLSTKALEAFFQEWLFFGLIIESLGGNSQTPNSSPSPVALETNADATQTSNADPAQEHNDAPSEDNSAYRDNQAIVDRVYRDFVYQADALSFITTRTFLLDLQTHGQSHCFPSILRETASRPGANVCGCACDKRTTFTPICRQTSGPISSSPSEPWPRPSLMLCSPYAIG
jgi:hypothetical protein